MDGGTRWYGWKGILEETKYHRSAVEPIIIIIIVIIIIIIIIILLKTLITLVNICLYITQSKVRIGNYLSSGFLIENDLKQGNTLSPLLFNFVLE